MRSRSWSLLALLALIILAGCQPAPGAKPDSSTDRPPTASASAATATNAPSASTAEPSEAPQAQSAAPPAGWTLVDWQGIRIAFPPDLNSVFHGIAETQPGDPARAAAYIQPTCPYGTDCLLAGQFRLYPNDGEDPRTWIERTEVEGYHSLADRVIDGRKGVTYQIGSATDGLGGPEIDYVVPVGSDLLKITFYGYGDEIVDYIDLNPTPITALTPGHLAKIAQDADLWDARSGGAPLVEHPRVHRGLPVTVLELAPDAANVRTIEGTSGWIRLAPDEALTLDLTINGDEARFRDGQTVVFSRDIPLRAEPNSQSAKYKETVAAGTTATLEDIRGDWLLVRLDDGIAGWGRWRYGADQYIAPK